MCTSKEQLINSKETSYNDMSLASVKFKTDLIECQNTVESKLLSAREDYNKTIEEKVKQYFSILILMNKYKLIHFIESLSLISWILE